MKLFYNCLSPPARAVKICLIHAKVEHETQNVDLMAGEHKGVDFVAINPAHCVPTIQVSDLFINSLILFEKDDDFVLWESRAILNYVANKFTDAGLLPTCPMARAKVDYMLNWDLGTFYHALTQVAGPKLGFIKTAVDMDKAEADLHEALSFLENHIIKVCLVLPLTLPKLGFQVTIICS